MDYSTDTNNAIEPLVKRSRFLSVPPGAYLATAGEGLMPVEALDAVERYMRAKSNPRIAAADQAETDDRLRQRLSRLCGVSARDIALLANASQGLTMIFALPEWRAGDNIVVLTNELEFPSLILPAVKLVRDHDVEMRVVDHRDWIVTPTDIANAVDSRTKMIVVSHVSYRTGYRLALEEVRREIGGSDAWLVVDASQSLGAVPVAAEECDFLVATSCKWMLGPHGVGVLYWNQGRTGNLTPRDIGWYSVVDDLEIPYDLKPGAARFELGSPDWPAIYGLEAGLALIEETSVESVAAHNEQLATAVLDEATRRGLRVITPSEPELRAGIVCWLDDDCKQTAQRLRDRDVFVTGSSGRVRVSTHLYNDYGDVQRLFDVL